MLHIHRAERADGLAAGLAEVLSEPLEDPFAAEIVAVPTRGMERWLTQRLSGRLGTTVGRSDGVCANVEFPFPGRLIGGAIATATGTPPDADPWLPERLVWPLLTVVEDCLDEPWLATLSRHLGAGESDPDRAQAGRERRFAALRRIADLYDHYAIRRPAMVRAWAAGADNDGSGAPLPADGAWQAELWRRLRAAIAQPSPAERLAEGCERLRREPTVLELPARLALFGLTRLPASYVQVLRALAAGREVHLFLLHPSPALWDQVARALGDGEPVTRRAHDRTADLPANRLLASWGADARELQLVLGEGAEHRERELVIGEGADHRDHHHVVGHPAATLLGRIQADIRADRPPPGPPLPPARDTRAPLDPTDRSIQVHSCHGSARQVEVLRDAILHLLAEDPTLEPRDVIVMCPEIEAFAPLIAATFGAGETREEADEEELVAPALRPPDLRVRLADRSLRQTNPLLDVIARLLELAGERVTASQLLDLADREPVRRRFRFDDEDLARIQAWIAQSGIRWGLDAADRRPFKLSALSTGTWRAGLDRVLLGATMTEEEQRLFAGVLPLDDVDSGSIELAGRFAELVERTQRSLESLRVSQSIDGWATSLAAAADALSTTRERDAWQRAELQRLLSDVVAEAGEAGAHPLTLPEVRALLAHRLRGRPTRANFRTGHLTVCTLVPMRSVPHRVVCLLGLDDGAFPRGAPRDGDDLLLADPHVGDRDPRVEDRQMLLDALMAAGEHLIVTYSGNDERTNAPRPPAVPVGELLDIVEETVRVADGSPARGAALTRHPLQPFDPRNFAGAEPWSFDRVALAGARALAGERRAPAPFLAEPLAPAGGRVIELDDLVAFAERPMRAFLRQRLGIALTSSFEEIEDALAVELDGLASYAVGHRLLEGVLAGVELDACAAAEVARGLLPPGILGLRALRRLRPAVTAIADAALEAAGAIAPRSVQINLALPDGRALTGTVSGVRREVLLNASFARISPRHRIAAWVRLLALSASHPEIPFEAAVVGRAPPHMDGAEVISARLWAPPADGVLSELGVLIDLYDRGMREPLPLACGTAAAYAVATRGGGDAVAAARKAWESGYNSPQDDGHSESLLVFGGAVALEQLLEPRPRPDESGQGWEPAEATRFGRLAHRLWGAILDHERITYR